MRIAVFDTETTGLIVPGNVPIEQQPYIVELFAQVVEHGVLTDSFHILVKPPVPLSAEITKITGITNADIEDCEPFEKHLGDVSAFFASCDAVVAHNMAFDEGMVTNEYARLGYTCPLPLTRICSVIEYMPRFGKRPTLKALYEHVTGRKLDQKHRAQADVDALVEILKLDGFFDIIDPKPAVKKSRARAKRAISFKAKAKQKRKEK